MAEREYDNPYSDEDRQQQAPAYDPNRFNTIKNYYSKYLGRDVDQNDQGFMGWVNGKYSLPDTEKYISQSDEAKNFAASQWNKQPSQPANQPNQPGQYGLNGSDWQWLQNKFNQYQIDPQEYQYWANLINQHGGVQSTGEGWLDDRLMRADSSVGVRNGTVQRFQDTAAPAVVGQQSGMDPMLQALMARIDKQSQEADAERQANKAKADSLYGQLMDRSKQSLAIDRNDPIIRAQADAVAASNERASRNYLSDLAEKAGPLANLRGEQRMASERLGQANSGFEAQLMGKELASRRQEIADALNGMRGMLSNDQQAQLQKELSSMDAAIRQQQLAQNNSQFGNDLALRYAQMAQQGNQFDRSMGQRADEFNKDLGYRYEDMDNAMLRYYMGLL